MTVIPFGTFKAPYQGTKRATESSELNRLPISATIITHNEADRISECIIPLLSLVNQIIVLDSGSQDQTREIALSLGAEVHHADWTGYGPQKRRAEDLCAHDWILNIDADERLTKALASEIRRCFTNKSPDKDAYRLRIVDKFPHEERPATWAFAYRRIRLYNRCKGRFVDSIVHDDVMMKDNAKVFDLKGSLDHESIRNLSDHHAKLNRYTDLQVRDMHDRGRRIPRWRLLTEFPVAFLKSYFLRRRIFYGWWGIIYSVNYAHMRFLRIAKAYEDRVISRDLAE